MNRAWKHPNWVQCFISLLTVIIYCIPFLFHTFLFSFLQDNWDDDEKEEEKNVEQKRAGNDLCWGVRFYSVNMLQAEPLHICKTCNYVYLLGVFFYYRFSLTQVESTLVVWFTFIIEVKPPEKKKLNDKIKEKEILLKKKQDELRKVRKILLLV